MTDNAQLTTSAHMPNLEQTPYRHRFSDRLVAVIKQRNSDTEFYRAKRVSAYCLLTPAEREAYVKFGPVLAIKLIRDNNSGMSLGEALNRLNDARYGKGCTYSQAEARAGAR